MTGKSSEFCMQRNDEMRREFNYRAKREDVKEVIKYLSNKWNLSKRTVENIIYGK